MSFASSGPTSPRTCCTGTIDSGPYRLHADSAPAARVNSCPDTGPCQRRVFPQPRAVVTNGGCAGYLPLPGNGRDTAEREVNRFIIVANGGPDVFQDVFQKSINLCALLSVALLCAAAPGALAKTAPEDGTGAYATGTYRNLFAEDGHSDREIRPRSTPPISNSSTATRRRRPLHLRRAAMRTAR